MANTTLHIRKSGISGNTPTSLNYGELALNYSDGKLFYKNDLGTISYIRNQDTFSSINSNGTLVIASSPADILNFNAGGGMTITTDPVTKTITFNTQAGQASDAANSASVYANGAFLQSNSAYDHANAAFQAANNVAPQVQPAFDTANSASIYANGAFTQSNSSFDAANTSGIYANGSFIQSNSAYAHANAAFAAANNVTPQVQPAFDTANSASLYANSAFIQANAAFNKANTGTSLADYFPTTPDYGYLFEIDITQQRLGDEEKQIVYDFSLDPVTPRGYFLSKDFGYLT